MLLRPVLKCPVSNAGLALLHEGRRTATLAAVTPCRVTVIPKYRIDRQVLEQVAKGRIPAPNARRLTRGLACSPATSLATP